MEKIPLQNLYAYYIRHRNCEFNIMNYNIFVYYYTKYINDFYS